MKRYILLCLLVVLGVHAPAQERISLTTPVFVDDGVSNFRIWDLHLRRAHPDFESHIRATYREVDGAGAFVAGGRSLQCDFDGAASESRLIALNKADLSATSLEKRVIQQCQSDGQLGAGSVIGNPE